MGMNTVYIKAYIAEITRLWNEQSDLQKTTTAPKKIVGDTAYFPVVGEVIAHKSNKGSSVQYLNADWEYKECKLERFEAPQIAYDADKNTFNYDEAGTMAQIGADAIRKAVNSKIIVDGLMQSAKYKAGDILGGNTQKMSVAFLTLLKQTLDDNNVAKDGREILYTPALLMQLLNDEKATSADYASVKSLINGDVDSYLGFHFTELGKMKEAGLPVDVVNNTVTGFAYHKSSLGSAICQNEESSVERDSTMQGWKHQTTIMIGATPLRDNDIIPFKCNTDNSSLANTTSAMNRLIDAIGDNNNLLQQYITGQNP